MKKSTFLPLTVLVAIACIGLPIWLAIVISERQAFEAESAHALGYARDVVLRGDESARQVLAAVRRLAPYRNNPCSPASLDEMREIDLGSSYLQAVGSMQGTRFRCSSMGTRLSYDLGRPDYRTSGGIQVWRNVRFPFAPKDRFLVIQSGGFAAIVHKQHAIDTAKSEPDVSLAVVSLGMQEPLAARGRIDAAWLTRLGKEHEQVFAEDGYIVALVRSPSFTTAGVAAVPMHYMKGRSDALSRLLIPAGVVAGLVLALVILVLGRQQMALSSSVRSALRRHEFFLEYQPIVCLQTGAWSGVEALVRWRRPTGEIVRPDLFIPIAEQSGLIVKLTQEVIALVARDAGPYLARNPDFHVGINVAPADFHSSDFLPKLQAALRGMRALPANLMLEVTERGLLDPAVAREMTGTLRRHGFALAIDDFGTGYSSLSYLEALELDYLKIDRSFIEAIGTGAPTSQVVVHIIGMARDLGLRMIAEGVESAAQADFLRKHGVHYGQGWLFGKPMPFAQVELLMEEQAAQAKRKLRAVG